MKRYIGILPIKEISNEVENKNFRMIAGKQMYKWVLENCIDSKITDIYVSCSWTEFKEELNEEYPYVKWIQRPEELNGEVELLEVMQHALSVIDDKDAVYMQIQVNKPLTRSYNINHFIDMFETTNANSLAQIQLLRTAVNWQYKKDKKQAVDFCSCSMAKMWDYETLKNAEKGTWGFGECHIDVHVSKHHIEIDTEEDFKIAEIFLKAGL